MEVFPIEKKKKDDNKGVKDINFVLKMKNKDQLSSEKYKIWEKSMSHK